MRERKREKQKSKYETPACSEIPKLERKKNEGPTSPEIPRNQTPNPQKSSLCRNPGSQIPTSGDPGITVRSDDGGAGKKGGRNAGR